LEECKKAPFDLFDVIAHFFEAAELVQDPTEQLLIAQLSLKTAIKGKNSMGMMLALLINARSPNSH
jgi:hypothetical protein